MTFAKIQITNVAGWRRCRAVGSKRSGRIRHCLSQEQVWSYQTSRYKCLVTLSYYLPLIHLVTLGLGETCSLALPFRHASLGTLSTRHFLHTDSNTDKLQSPLELEPYRSITATKSRSLRQLLGVWSCRSHRRIPVHDSRPVHRSF